MRPDRVCSRNGSALPLPLAGEGWGGGANYATDLARIEFPHPTHSAAAERVDLPRKRER
jgi:hypothetical protein